MITFHDPAPVPVETGSAVIGFTNPLLDKDGTGRYYVLNLALPHVAENARRVGFARLDGALPPPLSVTLRVGDLPTTHGVLEPSEVTMGRTAVTFQNAALHGLERLKATQLHTLLPVIDFGGVSNWLHFAIVPPPQGAVGGWSLTIRGHLLTAVFADYGHDATRVRDTFFIPQLNALFGVGTAQAMPIATHPNAVGMVLQGRDLHFTLSNPFQLSTVMVIPVGTRATADVHFRTEADCRIANWQGFLSNTLQNGHEALAFPMIATYTDALPAFLERTIGRYWNWHLMDRGQFTHGQHQWQEATTPARWHYSPCVKVNYVLGLIGAAVGVPLRLGVDIGELLLFSGKSLAVELFETRLTDIQAFYENRYMQTVTRTVDLREHLAAQTAFQFVESLCSIWNLYMDFDNLTGGWTLRPRRFDAVGSPLVVPVTDYARTPSPYTGAVLTAASGESHRTRTAAKPLETELPVRILPSITLPYSAVYFDAAKGATDGMMFLYARRRTENSREWLSAYVDAAQWDGVATRLPSLTWQAVVNRHLPTLGRVGDAVRVEAYLTPSQVERLQVPEAQVSLETDGGVRTVRVVRIETELPNGTWGLSTLETVVIDS